MAGYISIDRDFPFESGYIITPDGEVITLGIYFHGSERQFVARFPSTMKASDFSSEGMTLKTREGEINVKLSRGKGRWGSLILHIHEDHAFYNRPLFRRIFGDSVIEEMRMSDIAPRFVLDEIYE